MINTRSKRFNPVTTFTLFTILIILVIAPAVSVIIAGIYFSLIFYLIPAHVLCASELVSLKVTFFQAYSLLLNEKKLLLK